MSSSRNRLGVLPATALTHCYLCGSPTLEALPQPPGGRAVTTDGQLLDTPLRKYECLDCALVQSDPEPVLVEAAFNYESTYDFYNKPLMRAFDDKRYRSYADWVASFLCGSGARRVLEVGCGEGWVLQLLQDAYPSTCFQGLEPSVAAVRRASTADVRVSNGSTESNSLPAESFDFVYCINVLEHVADPIAFAKSLSKLLRPGGHALVICPFGSVIDPELMFADHLYSYSFENLELIARRGGLSLVAREQGNGMLYPLQALLATNASGPCPRDVKPSSTGHCPDIALAAARREYFARWAGLDKALAKRLGPADSVICFGAGETTDLLRAYTPMSWAAVRALMIDRPNGADAAALPAQRNGLPIHFVEHCPGNGFDCILLGIKPRYQSAVAERLQSLGKPVVRWDDLVPDPCG